MAIFAEDPARTLTPAEIIARTGHGEWAVRKALYRLSADGKLVNAEYGAYCLPGTTPTKVATRASLWARLIDLERRVAALEEK